MRQSPVSPSQELSHTQILAPYKLPSFSACTSVFHLVLSTSFSSLPVLETAFALLHRFLP
uniref:Uncharacterized protein n=1 Tax=Lotus japonicus TaxID=34305 RepID=I3SDN0_LOTJA|nr:unknown [Lotus japonicus]